MIHFPKAVQDYISINQKEDVFKVSLNLPKELKQYKTIIVSQIEGLQKSVFKLPTWHNTPGIIFPLKLSLEQASSELTALYKAKLSKGKLFLDGTGGFGVDSYGFSQSFERGIYCEKNPDLSQIVSQNFKTLNVNNIEISQIDSIDYLKNSSLRFDLLYFDPARRDGNNNKMVGFDAYTPNILLHLDMFFEKTDKILVKASPLLDLKIAISQLRKVSKIHILSIKNDCKEVLFELNRDFNEEIKVICKDLVYLHTFEYQIAEEEAINVEFGEVSNFIYEPNSSILKAGAFKLIGHKFGLNKLNVNTHLYTSESIEDGFPGKIFKVNEVHPFDEKKISKIVNQEYFNVIVRNFVLSAPELSKKLKIKDGGTQYIVAFKNHQNQPQIALCQLIKP